MTCISKIKHNALFVLMLYITAVFYLKFKEDSLAVEVASTLAFIVGVSFTKISVIATFCTKVADSSIPISR